MRKYIYTFFFAVLALACQRIDPLEELVTGNTIEAVSTVEIFSMDGGDDMITLTLKSESRQWAMAFADGADESWCTVSQKSGKTSSSIRLEIASNKNGAPRDAALVFSSPGCDNDTLWVNQEGLVLTELPSDKTYEYGINCDPENRSATLVLYDIDKDGSRHDYCYLLGDFNGWTPRAEYAMNRDESRKCWWYTLTDLELEEEYMFQYYLGYVDKYIEDPVRISDPFSEIIYTSGDSKIDSETYPNIPNYPSDTEGNVSAFSLTRDEFNWQHTWVNAPAEEGRFRIEDSNDLIIYELLIRDFSEKRNLQGVMERLDYLEELGINAIELMPVQEFDNSLSWGYDPNSYFALDKDYGTREMYKMFIDECHRRGIAVFFDVVYNHLTGASSLAKMYFRHCRTAINNPWFNQVTPHPYGVYHDLNHSDEFLNSLVKRNLKYLLTEYKIDGFRFDLTKGLTNIQCDEGSASGYKEDRVAFLKGYYDAIHQTNPNAVMICEHFCDPEEERVLGDYGIKLWRNVNNAYGQVAMGYKDNSDLSYLHTEGTSMPFGSLVSFMESHDEERIAYKQIADYAPERLRNNIELRMKRAGLSAAFSLLVPGPKMIWQFGELGYDFSINSNDKGVLVPDEDHRTDVKPIRWDYYDDGVEGEGEDEYRRGLYNTYSDLLAFRKHNSTLYDMGAEFRWYVSVDHWPGRYMFLQKDGLNMALFGNFGEGSQDISVELPHDGTWYNAFTGAQWKGKNHTPNMAEGDFYLLVDKLSAVLANSGSGDVESEGSEEEGGDEPGTGEGEGEGGAEEKNMLYLNPWQWTSDGARIEAYFFGSNGDKWVIMADSDSDGIYECEFPEGYTNVIFVRMDPAKPNNNWDSKWNQTVDLVIEQSKNLFTINSWEGGQDGKSTGVWSSK